MTILLARQALLRSKARSELRFCERALLPIAPPTGREHVVDRVRASTRQRNAMVDLKWADLTAVRTLALVALDDREPLGTFELPLSLTNAGAIGVALGSEHLGVSLVVRGHDRFVL